MFLKSKAEIEIQEEKTLENSVIAMVLRFKVRVLWRSGIRSSWKHSIPKYMNAMLSTVCSGVLDAGY